MKQQNYKQASIKSSIQNTKETKREISLSKTKTTKNNKVGHKEVIENSKKTSPFGIMKKIAPLLSQLIELLSFKQANHESELYTLRLMAEISSYLNVLPIEFIPVQFGVKELDRIIFGFSRMSEHKEVCVCLIYKIIESQFFLAAGEKELNLHPLKVLMKKLLSICEFCLELNKDSKSVIYFCIQELLSKISKWTSIIKGLEEIEEEIQMIKCDHPS